MATRGSAAAATVVALIATLLICAVPRALAAANRPVLDPTPPMGFNDWNAFGCNVDAQLIESTATAMHDNGMQAAGYRYVNIDDCWMAPQRDASGHLVADPAKFPQGIPAVARFVHHLGLKLGIYEDAGTSTCAGYPGSYGHEAVDAATFAAWGVDYLKYDQCNIPFANYPGQTHQQIDTGLYTTMSRALRGTHRPIVFSMCNGTDDTVHPWLWGAKVSNLWRTTTDISDTFASTVANFEGNVGLARYAHAGAFNDPDMLEIGNGGQTPDEYRAQFSLWSEMAAPLISGTDITKLSAVSRRILTDRAVIAVDQDALARQGHAVADAGGLWVLTKPLLGGDRAVVMFNSTGEAAQMATTARRVGAGEARSYRLEDLWTGGASRSAGPITAFVPARGVVMYRVHPVARRMRAGLRPHVSVALAPDPATTGPGQTVTTRVTVSDDARRALTATSVRLSAPAGWTVTPAAVRIGRVAGRSSVTRRVTVSTPATAAAPIAAPTLRATARYRVATRWWRESSSAGVPITLVGPLASPLTTANATGETATVGQAGGGFAVQAAGTGITPQTTSSHGTRPASDSYAAIDDPGAGTDGSIAQVTVTGQTGSTLRPYGSAGLIERASLTAAGTPEGVALSVSTAGKVTLSWNAQGGTVVDSTVTAPATVTLPVTLRLTRAGTSIAAAYSTDGGHTFVGVGTAQLAAAAAPAALDVGMFHSSGAAGWDTEADFGGFSVTR